MQTIILGIVESVPFTMRRPPPHDDHQEADWPPQPSKGAGTVMALPLLEAMVSSAKAAEEAAATRKRLQVIYTPNGMMMQNWTPASSEAGFAYSPILKPLEAYRSKITVFTGLSHVQAEALGDGAGDHGRCCGGYLTGIHVKKTEGADITSGISMDQMVAKQFGDQTQIPSLEIGLEPPSLVGSCDSGYSCAYTNTLAWSSPSTPLPVTINPREVFERMFGDGDSLDAKSRLAQLRRQASILDFVAADAKRMSGKLGGKRQAEAGRVSGSGARHREAHSKSGEGWHRRGRLAGLFQAVRGSGRLRRLCPYDDRPAGPGHAG